MLGSPLHRPLLPRSVRFQPVVQQRAPLSDHTQQGVQKLAKHLPVRVDHSQSDRYTHRTAVYDHKQFVLQVKLSPFLIKSIHYHTRKHHFTSQVDIFESGLHLERLLDVLHRLREHLSDGGDLD
jgi:hypothetical protein